VVVLVYIPTNSVRGFLFPRIRLTKLLTTGDQLDLQPNPVLACSVTSSHSVGA
jgi:hypothetical protein